MREKRECHICHKEIVRERFLQHLKKCVEPLRFKDVILCHEPPSIPEEEQSVYDEEDELWGL